MKELKNGRANRPEQVYVACTDGMNRPRDIRLWTAPASKRIVLVVPPAEAALMTPQQARELASKLNALATKVENQHAVLTSRVEPDAV